MGFIAGLIDVVDHLGRRLVKPNSLGNYQPVRLKLWPGASTTCVDRGDGTSELQIAAPSDVLSFATNADFRAATPPADGTFFRVVSPAGEFRYSASSGAGWADDNNTILKPNSVLIGSNGRAYSTKASEHAATFAAARAMRGLIGHARHVHIESHTQRESAGTAADGGGGVFDVIDPGDYAYSDDNGTVLICADGAVLVRRSRTAERVTPKWWGGAADYNRNAGTGGANDDAALHAALAYAVAVKKTLFIPDGNWKLTAPLALSKGVSIRCESFERCVIHCLCDIPLVAASGVTDFKVDGGAWLATGVDHTVLFDIWGTFNTDVDIALGGAWTVGVQCYRDAGARAGAGYWYTGSLRVRDFQWTSTSGFTQPAKPALPISLVGEFIDLSVRPDYNQPTNTAVGCLIENYSGAISHDVQVEGLIGGNGATHKPDIAIHIKNIKNVTTGRIYAEACGAGIYFEDCWGVACLGTVSGDTIVFDGCTNIKTVPQLTYVKYVDCTGPNGQGGGFGTAGLTGAWESDNVDLVDTGFSFQSGQVYAKAGWTYVDQENLLLHGDFRRWTSGVPWGWTWTINAGASITQCGTGLVDTTKTADSPYCAHLVTDGSSIISGLTKLTGPLGNQYLGSTVSFSAKIKRTAGTVIMKIANSSGVASGDLWVHLNTTPAEDGFVLFTGQCKITANEQSGLYLMLIAATNVDVYVGPIEVHFGRQVCRAYAPPRRTFDGSIERNAAGNLILSASSVPGSTDPFYGKAYLERDFALNSGTADGYGWTYHNGVWVAFGQTEEEQLVAQIKRVDVSNKIASLVLGADFTGSGAWKARIGADCASAGAAQATVGAIRNRKAAVFAQGGTAMGYALPKNCAEYWGVARFDGSLPASNYPSVVGGAGPGARLMLTVSDMIADCTITRDGASSTVVDAVTRIWRATDTAEPTADKHIGSYGPAAANNWVGPIGLGMAVTTAFTAEEAEAIYTLVKNYFAK